MNPFEKERAIESEKPPFLYHGSPNRDIDELEPRQKTYRDLEEGPQLFASQELSVASMFLFEGSFSSGLFNKTPYAAIVGSREEIMQRDRGGHVYVLPSETFSCDPHKGLGEYEWTTRDSVKPIKTIEYPSAIDAMMENGVQVYFIDQETRDRIDNSADHGFAILSSLESENMRRGIKVKPLGAD